MSDSRTFQSDPVKEKTPDFIRERSGTDDELTLSNRRKLEYFLINSTAAFILAYLIVYLFTQAITMLAAFLNDITSVLYYYEIRFGISNTSPEWTPFRIVLVTATGPVISLITGYFILYWVVKKRNLKPYHKLFLIWLGFHAMTFFFGGIFAGTMVGHGIGYALDVLFWPALILYYVLSLIGLICLFLIGYDFTHHFLRTNPSNYWSKRENRIQFLIYSLVIPWFFGSVLLFSIKIPDHAPQHPRIMFHDFLILLSMIVLILPMFFRKRNTRFRPKNVPAEQKNRIWWLLLLVTLIVLFCFRFMLTSNFYLRFT